MRISLEQITGPERENKVNTYRAMIEHLGGVLVEGQPDQINLIESGQTGGNYLAPKYLIDRYFWLAQFK